MKQASDQGTPWRPCLWKGQLTVVIQAIRGFSYKKTTPFIISTITQKGYSHENFLLHFYIEARLHGCCNHVIIQCGSCLLAPLTVSEMNASCGHGTCMAQYQPVGHTELTAAWVTKVSVHNGPAGRISSL